MLSRLSHNWTLKLTALVLSLALWSHVRGQVNPWETATFKARFKAQAPRGFMLLNAEALPKTVVVTLRGPRLTLRSLKGAAPANPLATTEDAPLLSAAQLSAAPDFSSPRKGLLKVPIKAQANIEDVEVVGAKPNEIAIALDAAETRLLKIVPQISQSDEVEIETVSLNVKQAQISGPSKLLDRVEKLRVRVGAGELRPGVLQMERAPLEAIDGEGDVILGIPIEPAFVRLEIKTSEKSGEKSVRIIARAVGKPSGDFQIGAVEAEPSRIKVRGPRRVLDDLKSLKVEVDVGGATENISRRARVDLPRGVQAASSTRVRVRVEITARAGSTPMRDSSASPSPTPFPTPTANLPSPARDGAR